MTNEEIINFADECDLFDEIWQHPELKEIKADKFIKFAYLIAAAEREAIASILDKYDHAVAPSLMAKAIRARGDALTRLNKAAEDNGEEL
jgi:hypothetical protein